MKHFIKANDVDMWEIVENGYNLPIKVENNITILKPRSDWSEEEKRKHLIAIKEKWIVYD